MKPNAVFISHGHPIMWKVRALGQTHQPSAVLAARPRAGQVVPSGSGAGLAVRRYFCTGQTCMYWTPLREQAPNGNGTTLEAN